METLELSDVVMLAALFCVMFAFVGVALIVFLRLIMK